MTLAQFHVLTVDPDFEEVELAPAPRGLMSGLAAFMVGGRG